MGLLHYVSLVAMLAAFAFVTLSLASGLLYISELIEEHSRLAKVVGQRGIYVIISLHILFYFSDSLPFIQTIFSIFCHLVYLQNFSSNWPLISLTSPSFIASCILVIADHFTWFFHFSRVTHEARYTRNYHALSKMRVYSFTEIAAFFGLCVWLVPLFLFLSLSANDNALPTAAAEPGSPNHITSSRPSSISLFKSLFSMLPIKKLRRLGSSNDPTSGIIAPRTHQPKTPSVGSISMTSFAPPPSPSLSQRLQDGYGSDGSGSNIQLSAPPRRQTIRVQRGEAGLGLRRNTGNMGNGIPSKTD